MSINNEQFYDTSSLKYNEKRNLRKKSSGIGFYVFSYFMTMAILGMAMTTVLLLFNIDISKADNKLLFFLVNIFVSVFSAFIIGLFYLLFSNTKLNEIISVKYVKQKTILPIIFVGMSVALVANYIADLLTNNFSLFGLTNNVSFDYATTSVFENIVYIISVAFVPAIVEEFAFRGIVMGSLRKFGDSFAIIASAVLFGAMHGNITQIPFAFVLGLIFAFVDCKTNSILPSIIIHFINNFYSVILDILNKTGILSQQLQLVIYYSFAVIVCLFGILGFIYLIKKDKTFLKLSNNCDSQLLLKEKVKAFILNPGIILSFSAFFIETVLSLGFING